MRTENHQNPFVLFEVKSKTIAWEKSKQRMGIFSLNILLETFIYSYTRRQLALQKLWYPQQVTAISLNPFWQHEFIIFLILQDELRKTNKQKAKKNHPHSFAYLQLSTKWNENSFLSHILPPHYFSFFNN